MPAQTSAAQQPDNGAALILGGVLGLLLASVAAIAVGVWQYRQSQVTVSPAVIVPSNQSLSPVGSPVSGEPYGNASGSGAYGAPTSVYEPQPATIRPGPQFIAPTAPNAESSDGSAVAAPASTVTPSLPPPDASNSVELPSEDSPPDSDGE